MLATPPITLEQPSGGRSEKSQEQGENERRPAQSDKPLGVVESGDVGVDAARLASGGPKDEERPQGNRHQGREKERLDEFADPAGERADEILHDRRSRACVSPTSSPIAFGDATAFEADRVGWRRFARRTASRVCAVEAGG